MPVNTREVCPKCGSEVEQGTTTPNSHTSWSTYECVNCNWWCIAHGRWTSPRRQEDFPEGSIGWIEESGG